MDVDKPDALRMGYFAQLILSAYGGRFSYVAITKLRKYEETTKAAAKWSQLVDDQLLQTRTTQATGALILILSTVAALTLLWGSKYLHPWVALAISPTILVATIAGRTYVKRFWAPYKTRDGKDVGQRLPLPFMEEYNEAEFMTERLLEVLQYLEYSWLATSFFTAMGYSS